MATLTGVLVGVLVVPLVLVVLAVAVARASLTPTWRPRLEKPGAVRERLDAVKQRSKRR